MLFIRSTTLLVLVALSGCPMKNSDPDPKDAGGAAAPGRVGGASPDAAAEMTKLPSPDATAGDPGKPLAEGCATNAECASGFCSDGVCCNSACDQACYSCHTSGSYGTCLPQLSGDDPTATPGCTGAKTCGLSPNPSSAGLSVCALKDLQACTSNAACASDNCVSYYVDADGDGWGNTADPIRICNEPSAAAPSGFSTKSGDCCDTDAAAHPGSTLYSSTPDACGSFDINCDGTIEIQPGCGSESDPNTCGMPCTLKNTFDLNPIACL
jgi:hypothetical protein